MNVFTNAGLFIKTLRPEQIIWSFAGDIFFFMQENVCILVDIFLRI